MNIRHTIRLYSAALLALTFGAPIAVQGADQPPQWKSSAAAGITLTRGNSETFLGTFSALSEKKWDQHEISFGGDATYGESDTGGVDTKTAESVRGFIQYNYLFNERLYGYARFEALHDGIAAIRYRATLSPGAGYYFIKDKRTELSGECGPGYVWDNVGGVTRHFPTLRIAERFKHELSDRARVWQTFEFLPSLTRLNNFIINVEVGIEADLTADKNFTLRAYIQDTFNNEPAPGRKKNDMKLVTALAYKF